MYHGSLQRAPSEDPRKRNAHQNVLRRQRKSASGPKLAGQNAPAWHQGTADGPRTSETKYVDFLQGCLQWNTRERFTPEDALQQEWILEGYARHAAQKDPRSSEHAGHSQASSSRRSGFGQSTKGGHQSIGAAGNTTGGGGGGGSFIFPPIESNSGLPAAAKPTKHRSSKGSSQAEAAATTAGLTAGLSGSSGPSGSQSHGVASGSGGPVPLGGGASGSHQQQQDAYSVNF